MIIRNGRNEVQDVGPRRTWEPSNIRSLVGYTDTPGGWTGDSHAALFANNHPHNPRGTGGGSQQLPQATITCEFCGTSATRYRIARFCSTRCQNAAAQRARRSRLKEAKL